MIWLITGVILWTVVHSIKAVFPAWRQRISGRLGSEKSKGPFALGILLSLGLIIFGWRQSDPAIFCYIPSTDLRVPGMTLIVLAIYFISLGPTPVRIRRWIRHPMLTSVILWSLGHLILNGEARSVILFAGLALWAILEIIFINKRDGTYVAPEPEPIKSEVQSILITIAATIVLLLTHGIYTGRALVHLF